jgi:hypothetical protein
MKTTFPKSISLYAFAIVTVATAGFFPAVSQAQSFRGSIRGTVTDPSGGVIPESKIVAKNLATSELRETTTGDDGAYVLPELVAGDYEVSAEKRGFQRIARRATVAAGANTVVDIGLLVSGDSFVTTVAAPPELIEPTSSTLEQIVDRQLVQELPLNGRDFGKLVALTPGVTVEGSGVAGTEKGFGQFNINGNRDRSNNYTLGVCPRIHLWFAEFT